LTDSEPTAGPTAADQFTSAQFKHGQIASGSIPRQRPASGGFRPLPFPPAFPPGFPPGFPSPLRRSRLWPGLVALLVLSMLLAVGGATIAVAALRADAGPSTTGWVDMRPAVRDAALNALLERRAKAVRAKDKAAFLADIDQSDPALVKREQLLYDNLAKIPFTDLRYQLQPWRKDAQLFLTPQIRDRYREAAHVGAVTMRYRIEGIDSKPVATPWLPVFAYTGGRWLIGAEATDKNLPYGANGQPWDAAGPITVLRSRRVVAVLSADDADRGPYLLQLAERGLDRLAITRTGGWDGKIFLTAVQDKRIFDAYFADSPERIAQVAAIAVPYYDRVADWSAQPAYAATRIVFNPQELSAQPEALAHDLTHEFTHAAMGPVTSGYTPRWLVEGFAEYAAYNGTKVPTNWVKRTLGDLDVSGGLPTDAAFYAEPRNYVGGWLACKMIAEHFGAAKLIALYEAFQRVSDPATAIQDVLGVEKKTLETQWLQYVGTQRQ
jgi:hypothetical protein